MRLYTTTIDSGSFTIVKTYNVLQWSVEPAVNPSAVYQITGDLPLPNVGTPSTAIVPSGAYNSIEAPTNSPWEGVTINVVSGSVQLVLSCG